MARLTLRHIASIILLATYLPMVLLSSLHTHHDTVDSHDNCLQCAGHFETHHHHQHDCLFCNFLSLYYHGQPLEQPRFILPSAETTLPAVVGKTDTQCAGAAMLRAPPTA